MRKLLTLAFTLSLITACVCLAEAEREVNMTISPDTVVLEELGQTVLLTVHAEIAYSAVSTSTVKLNNVVASLVKYDSRGELVAKFNMSNLPEGTVTLKLTGELKDGTAFSGSDDICVIIKMEGGPGSDKRQNQKGNREGPKD